MDFDNYKRPPIPIWNQTRAEAQVATGIDHLRLTRAEYVQKFQDGLDALRADHDQAIKTYLACSTSIEAQFKTDALAELALTGHPKANQAFQMAWDRGYADGYAAVFNELRDLAELLI